MSTIYSTAFVIQGSFLMNWDKIISFTNKKIRKKLKVLVAFLSNQKNWWATRVPPPLFFLSKSFDQNYDKAI